MIALASKMGATDLNGSSTGPAPAPPAVQYGRALMDQFPFDPAYRNMNHGQSNHCLDRSGAHQLILALHRLLRLHPQGHPE